MVLIHVDFTSERQNIIVFDMASMISKHAIEAIDRMFRGLSLDYSLKKRDYSAAFCNVKIYIWQTSVLLRDNSLDLFYTIENFNLGKCKLIFSTS